MRFDDLLAIGRLCALFHKGMVSNLNERLAIIESRQQLHSIERTLICA